VIKPYLEGKDVKAYCIENKKRYLILLPAGWTNSVRKSAQAEAFFQEKYSSIYKHLKEIGDSHIRLLASGQQARGKGLYDRDDQGDYWWELRSCVYYKEFLKNKIVLPDISVGCNFSFDTQCSFLANTAYIIPETSLEVLAILNSKLTYFFYQKLSPAVRGGYLRFIYQYLVQIPIPNLNADQKAQLAEWVQRLLDLHAQPVDRVGLKPTPTENTCVRDGFKPAPTHGIPEIIRAFKTFSSRKINQTRATPGAPVWQRGYYDHIIRNEADLTRIREYIQNNPAQWALDSENPLLHVVNVQQIDNNTTIEVTTPLAGAWQAKILKQCAGFDYKTRLIYVWLPCSAMARERVKNRVAQGGHDVPADLIERRYKSGLVNLHRLYLPIVENALILDGNELKGRIDERMIACKQKGQFEIIQPEKWRVLCQTM
jgi:predicted ABC-type ATPase